MKSTKKKNQKQKGSPVLPVEKRIVEQRYSEKEGLPNENRPYPDYPFTDKEDPGEAKKEAEEE